MRAPGEGAAVALYRLLLRLLPRSFRREHGEESVALFRRTLRDGWSGGGARGLSRAALRGWLGALRGAGEEARAALRRRAVRGPDGGSGRHGRSLGAPWTQAARTIRRQPVLAGSALLASWIPARLAAGTDPAAIMQ